MPLAGIVVPAMLDDTLPNEPLSSSDSSTVVPSEPSSANSESGEPTEPEVSAAANTRSPASAVKR